MTDAAGIATLSKVGNIGEEIRSLPLWSENDDVIREGPMRCQSILSLKAS